MKPDQSRCLWQCFYTLFLTEDKENVPRQCHVVSSHYTDRWKAREAHKLSSQLELRQQDPRLQAVDGHVWGSFGLKVREEGLIPKGWQFNPLDGAGLVREKALSPASIFTSEVPLSKASNLKLLPGHRQLAGCPLLRYWRVECTENH